MRIFRKAIAGDADQLSILYKELATLSPVNVLAERITEISSDPNTYLIVYEDGGDILATALLSLCNDVMFKRQPFAVLENAVVHKVFQRKGVGKELMEHIENFCIEKNCSKIMLLSSKENRDACNFYTAMGYNPDAKQGFIKYRRHFGN